MEENQPLFLRLRKRLTVRENALITLGDLCQLYWDGQREETLAKIPVYKVRPEDGDLVIVDIMQIIKKLRTMYPDVVLEVQGASQLIVEVTRPRKRPHLIAVVLVWLLLFVGSGLAIMNFHADVSMPQVHQRIYYLITGEQDAHPMLLQIPYSIGIGLGMVLFFNHIFRKKINEEPSPLDVEMFLYQQNLDQYYLQHENKENEKDKS
nr:stage V sporulation protein AA [Brevibacillus dissolubilis]